MNLPEFSSLITLHGTCTLFYLHFTCTLVNVLYFEVFGISQDLDLNVTEC